MLAVNLFHMRGGRVLDRREFFWEDLPEFEPADSREGTAFSRAENGPEGSNGTTKSRALPGADDNAETSDSPTTHHVGRDSRARAVEPSSTTAIPAGN